MKILVMSDSHKTADTVLEVVSFEKPDYILHLGDHEYDCNATRAEFPDIPLRTVRGNCDGFSKALDIDEFVLENKRFVMTHGHLFGVKLSTSRIISFAESKEADILLYGHTHNAHIDTWQKMQILNPGSIGYGFNRTYAIIEINNGTMACEIRRHLS